jgi:hypothetical protein
LDHCLSDAGCLSSPRHTLRNDARFESLPLTLREYEVAGSNGGEVKIRYLGDMVDQRSVGLLPGNVYAVLALWIDIESKSNTVIVLNDDLHSPARISAATFEVVDQSIPKMWEIEVTLESVLMAPQEWQSKQFWQDLFAGRATAIHDFEVVLPELYEQVTGEPLRRPKAH